MPDFQDFRDGPGADIARRVFDLDIADLESWSDFRSAVSSASNKLGFIERIQTETAPLSSSEIAIALAMLYAVGYGDQADRTEANFLSNFTHCSGAHRTTALAALAAIGQAGG